MSTLNYNLATISNFKLEISDASEINYFIQTVELPTMSLPEVITPYTDQRLYIPGDTLEYDPLNITFLVDEDYTNYIYLHTWIKECRPKNTGGNFPFRDITLHILNNNKNTGKQVRFYYAFPTMLGSIQYDSSQNDSVAVICTTVFRYQEFEFVE